MIFPLLEVTETAFIGISTVLDDFNHFSKFLTLKDNDGDDFFNVIRIELICDACKKLPIDMQKKCKHAPASLIPPWKSGEKNDRSKILAKLDLKAGRNARESMGIVTGI